MKILFVPLDERPCNYDYPQHIAETDDNLELIIPPLEILGKKKTSADIDQIWEFVKENARDVDAAVLSIDMLLFGGLIPSRIHHLDAKTVDAYFDNLVDLKEKTGIPIYAFECIMRSPSYDSLEEEPDYYEAYGYRLYRRAYLQDLKQRESLTEDEEQELNTLEIPNDIIVDYETRRQFNLEYNLKVAGLVKAGIIDFLVIPQDDSSQYGYTAIAQKRVVKYLDENGLKQKVSIYPGADEVGLSLLAKVTSQQKQKKNKVFVLFSSTLGETIIPLYEDRPMGENLKYHLEVTNAYRVDRVEDADFILAINSPGKIMEESFDQENKDISYTSFRNLNYFMNTIKRYLDEGYKVAVCDSAFSNGGDIELVKGLDDLGVLDQLLAYGGWNTNSNTLGTVLTQSIIGLDASPSQRIEALQRRLIEDVLYQAQVRQDVVKTYLPENDLSYYNFKDKQSLVEKEIGERLMVLYNEYKLAKTHPLQSIRVGMPWQRMFEISLKIE